MKSLTRRPCSVRWRSISTSSISSCCCFNCSVSAGRIDASNPRGTDSDGALPDRARPCNPGDRPALALSEPDRIGAAAWRHRHRAGKYDVLFPADDMFALERVAEPGVLGREPLNGELGHRTVCRAPRAVLPGEAARERFGAGVTFRASKIPCRCAV